MKILHVIDSLNVGGAEKLCCDILKMLHNSGFTADCLTISDKGVLFAEVEKFTNAICLNRKHKFSFKDLNRCAKIISQYDIVHVHMRHTWGFVTLACFLFKVKKSLVFHDHYWKIDYHGWNSLRFKLFLKPKIYIGVSRKHIDWATDYLEINSENAILLPNTIIPNYSKSDKYSGDLLMVANLSEVKNVLFAIKLAEKLRRRLTIFGNTNNSDYSRQVIEEVLKSDYVDIVQGESNIQLYIQNFSIGIHTSYNETGPLVLIEYLAHGLPFVTYSTGETVRIIEHDFPEFISYSFSLEEWENKIDAIEKEILKDKEGLVCKLNTVFSEKFSTEMYLNKCLNIYKTALTC